jgi:hypothetical protein
MSESTYISDANFSKYLSIIKAFPYNLFDSDVGAIYAPWEMSSLYQDIAMTMPVTDHGQPVHVMLDVSGNGNHWLANSDTARPVYNLDDNGIPCVQFDGSTSGMYAIEAAKNTLFKAVNYSVVINLIDVSEGTFDTIFRANTSSNTSLLELRSSGSDSSIAEIVARRSYEDAAIVIQDTITNPALYSILMDFSGGHVDVWKDNALVGTDSLASQGATPNTSANGIFLGNYNSANHAALKYYGGVIISSNSDILNNRADLESWVLEKSGMTL